MRCPYCGASNLKVIDSRPNLEENTIKRRRECLNCKKRFSTYEIIEEVSIMVIKKNGKKEFFDREKLLKGLVRACLKRNIDMQQMESIVSEIEKDILNSMDKEITSKELGDMMLEKLRDIDEVSYIRFASVYKEFKDIDSFFEELNNIKNNKKSK